MVKDLPVCAGDIRITGSIPGSGRPREKEMTIHSCILACEIPWTEEPVSLQSMGMQRVGYDLVTEHAHTGRRQWHPTPVLLPGKSHGWRSLVGLSPWGRKELDTTEQLPFTFHFHALEKEMATHSSVLAWRIPGTGEPGGLPSMGSHRVGHD